jgi:aminopeptidase N
MALLRFTAVPGDLRSAIYRAGIMEGGDRAYHELLAYYMTSTNAADKTQILYALGKAKDVHLLLHTLEISIDPTIVRPQDRVYAISGVSTNPLGRDLAWNFFREHYDEFNSRYVVSLSLCVCVYARVP